MDEQYNAVLRYDVLGTCRTPFRTGNQTELLRDGDGVPFIQGTGIRGALRKWAREHFEPADADRFFDGGELIISDGVFEPESRVNLRSCTGIDRDRGIAVNGEYFQMEVLPAGSRFSFCVIWRGMGQDVPKAGRLTETLLSALHRGEIMLGSRDALGFGQVSLQVMKRTYDLTRREDREDWLETSACWPEAEGDEKSVPLELENRGEPELVVFRVKGMMDQVLVGGNWGGFSFEEAGRKLIPASSVRGTVKRQAEGILRSVEIRDGALIERMFGREVRRGNSGRSSVICLDARLEESVSREKYRIQVDRSTGTVTGKKKENAVRGNICIELLAPDEGEICALLLLVLRDLALGVCGLGSGVSVGLGRIRDAAITADAPNGGTLTMIFDGTGNCTLEDPAGIAREWMEKWGEYCGQKSHGA